jgi:hypothetical protein
MRPATAVISRCQLRQKSTFAHQPGPRRSSRQELILHRRADALAQRAADLKRLADAWQPLYQTLTPDQKRRLGLTTIIVLRRIGNAVEAADETEDTEDTEE